MPAKSGKKGAVGLSLNVLVIIIISLVILAGGVVLLYQFIGGAEDLKTTLDRQTEQELERLLIDEGKRVVLPLHTATVFAGDDHVFGVGILNINEAATFQLQLATPVYISGEGGGSEYPAALDWLLYREDAFTIDEFGTQKEAILVQVPNDAPRGTYLFDLRVFSDGEQYGNPQKFTVIVK